MKNTRSAFISILLAAASSALGQLTPGSVDLSFDAGSTITQPVNAAAVLADGKVVIAGDFTVVNGAAANGVAQLLANGATDLAFTNSLRGLTASGKAVAVQLDGKVLVGGSFSDPVMWWLSTPGLVRLNPDGSRDTTFGSPVGASVFSLAVQNDGKVLVAGSFNSSGRRGILRLNTDGTVDNNFLYGLPGANGSVSSVALLPSGQILIGGSFTTVNGSPKNGVARLNANGSVDESFTANVTGVSTLAAQTDGKVVIGGSFTVVNGASLNRIARLNADGSLDGSFLSGLSGADFPVRSLSIQSDGKVLVGGSFSSINGVSRPGLARLNANGSLDGSFSTGPGGINGAVYFITPQPNGQTIIVGSFNAVGAVPRNCVARLGTSGSLDSSFANGPVIFTGGVSSLARQADGKILANSVVGTRIGRFHTNGAPDSSFLAGLSGANDRVAAIAVQPSGKILAAGDFTQFNGVPARALVRLDSGGSVDPTFQNGIGGSSGSIYCLKLQPDGKILIGGSFTQVKNFPRLNLARLNPDGSLDSAFLGSMAGVDGEVYSLALQTDGKILVGGSFGSVNGVARMGVARLNTDGSLDRTFQEGMAGVGGLVTAIAQQPDLKVVIVGVFDSVNGAATACIARLAPDGSSDTNFVSVTGPAPPGGIAALALQADGRILVGGYMNYINGVDFNNIARLRTNGSPETFLQAPLGANAEVTALLVLDSTNVLVGGAFGALNGAPRSYLARLAYAGPAVPLDVALNNSDLLWTNDAVAYWQGQTGVSHDSVASAQSGSLADSESSTLRSSVTGPGCISFWWKVSSERGWDYLTFTSTGTALTNQVRISGEVDWQQQTVCLPEGVHTLQWTYSKDGSVTAGLDAGWVDEVTFTPGNSAPIITLNPVSSTNYAGGSVSFTAAASGVPLLSYQWLHNGSEIPNATNAVYSAQSIVPEQAGSYSVRVTNPNGSSFSAAAALTIIPISAAGLADYSTNVALSTVDAVAVAAGQYHSLILRRDGTVYAWGNNDSLQCAVPANLGSAAGIAAGGYHSLAIKADRTVAGWGDNSFGQIAPPAGLSNVVAVAAGMWHSLALRENGTVVGWGDNAWNQSAAPASLSNIVAIAAGGTHSLALRADGLVFGWGGNQEAGGSYAGQATVPWNLQSVVAIGAGGYHSLAVKSDGTIVGWGDNSQGQLTVPTNLPPAISIAGGGAHTVAVLGDGTAAAWGENFDKQCDISRTLTNVVAVAAGEAHSLLLFGQRPPPPSILMPAYTGGRFSVQVPSYVGKLYALEYVNSVTATNWTSLPAVRGTGHVLPLTDSTASAAQRYYRVRQW